MPYGPPLYGVFWGHFLQIGGVGVVRIVFTRSRSGWSWRERGHDPHQIAFLAVLFQAAASNPVLGRSWPCLMWVRRLARLIVSRLLSPRLTPKRGSCLGMSVLAITSGSGTDMTGRPGHRTMEVIGGSSASYLACTPCVPSFCTLFSKGGSRRAFRLQGRAGIMSIVQWTLRPVILGVDWRVSSNLQLHVFRAKEGVSSEMRRPCRESKPLCETLDGRNRAIVIAESLARIIVAIRIASVRWRSHLPQKHRN